MIFCKRFYTNGRNMNGRRRVNRRRMTDDGRREKASLVFTVVCGLLSVVCLSAMGQSSPQVNFEAKKYPFVKEDINEITNASVLNGLFEKLYQQRIKNNQKISLLDIGDSHIQADMLSGIIRNDIQKDFGNAGRGLVVPLRVSCSNEPYNYKITSNIKWYGKRCVYINDSLNYGIGGFVAKTSNDSAVLNIRVFDYPPLNYSCNKVSLFYEHDSSFGFALYDTLGSRLGELASDSISAFLNYARTTIPVKTNYIVVRLEKKDSTQNHATIYGFSLQNDSNGVLYNVIGVNGAEAYQYAAAPNFAIQTALL